MTVCDECGAPIDQSGYCIGCGLSAPDFKDREFARMVLHGALEGGSYETREREARKDAQYGRGYGYTCVLCYEMLKTTIRADASQGILKMESDEAGFEQPGTDIARFNSKLELEQHIDVIHGGRKVYWAKVNDRKRMAKVRALDKLNSDTDVSTSQRDSE